MSADLRWVQRLHNLERAHARLVDACALQAYTDLETAGLVQTFEFTFELAWKTLKDRLTHEGFEVNSPRQAITIAFQAGMIGDVDRWLDMLGSRNTFSHLYEERIATEAVAVIRTSYLPLLSACVTMLRSAADAE